MLRYWHLHSTLLDSVFSKEARFTPTQGFTVQVLGTQRCTYSAALRMERRGKTPNCEGEHKNSTIFQLKFKAQATPRLASRTKYGLIEVERKPENIKIYYFTEE